MTLLSRQTLSQSTEKVKEMTKNHPTLFQNDPAYHLSSLRKAPEMASIIWEIKSALEKGVDPEIAKGGSLFVYIMKDRQGLPIAIFKPTIGPKDDSVKREVASFYLDHNHYAGVLPIVLTQLTHPIFGVDRKGSCQFYLEEGQMALDVRFINRTRVFSAPSVRKIAQLDIRLLNMDRHLSNLLVTPTHHLVPIDHQLVIPKIFGGVCLQWEKWSQAKTSFSEDEKRYIEGIDLRGDYEMLRRELGFSKEEARLYCLATILLQEGVRAGLNAAEIASLLAAPPGRVHEQMSWKLAPFDFSSQLVKVDPEEMWEGFCRSAQEEMKRITSLIRL